MQDNFLQQFSERDIFARHVGIELIEVSDGRAVARMKISDQHMNGMNVVHGGAVFALADLAFAAAANSYGTVAMAINVSISYLKARTGGVLTAEAREISKTRKITAYSVEVRDETGDLTATFQGMAYRTEKAIFQ
jgi:acyl-CoA thioesterase